MRRRWSKWQPAVAVGIAVLAGILAATLLSDANLDNCWNISGCRTSSLFNAHGRLTALARAFENTA